MVVVVIKVVVVLLVCCLDFRGGIDGEIGLILCGTARGGVSFQKTQRKKKHPKGCSLLILITENYSSAASSRVGGVAA